ncbi:hypothetical protein L6164_011989 [Bauhinia variegata]|uniref:Uncharacterized protein n=1 Tax=Bauhinia variegata TaxID=167791 RepID=A0ACB9P7S6_BAUVA|nr:hypothetical protein L6164_011989 [Bauhinia variegata]
MLRTKGRGTEDSDDEDDLFGTNDDDEDFNLFSTSKSPTKVDKPRSISDHSLPHRHRLPTIHSREYPSLITRSTFIPKSAGVFTNSGYQKFSGLVNLTGNTEGFFNGSVIVGDNNCIIVRH